MMSTIYLRYFDTINVGARVVRILWTIIWRALWRGCVICHHNIRQTIATHIGYSDILRSIQARIICSIEEYSRRQWILQQNRYAARARFIICDHKIRQKVII